MAKQILYPLVDRGDTFVLPHYVARRDYPEAGVLYGFDLCFWPSSDIPRLPITWTPALRFSGNLSVTDYRKGRSSACYEVLIKTTGEKPTVGLMSCAAFLPLIGLLQNGCVNLEWTFVKRGSNYLIEAVKGSL